ncbi:unnamed protein product [Oikopleura dioica]|uniref:Uncharacterized protein n=1 Tax=Oikopleura dioica TaxID=34765 RepID=E4X0K8_OIKDI|nr:unnamed protein product [Oikopleura dioica]
MANRMRESPAIGGKVAFATINNFAEIVDEWFPRPPKLVLFVQGGPLANCSAWPRHKLVKKLKLLFFFAAKTQAVVIVSGDRFDIDAQLTRLNSKFKQSVNFLAVLDESEDNRDSNLTHTLLARSPSNVRSCLKTHWSCPNFNVLLAAKNEASLEHLLSKETPMLLNPLETTLSAIAAAVRKKSKRALNSFQALFFTN